MIKLRKIVSEIKIIKNQDSEGYIQLKEILPIIKNWFPDAILTTKDSHSGPKAFIYFENNNLIPVTERFGNKWKIDCNFYENMRCLYYLDNNPSMDEPQFFPDYETIFPQDKNKNDFLIQIKEWFNLYE